MSVLLPVNTNVICIPIILVAVEMDVAILLVNPALHVPVLPYLTLAPLLENDAKLPWNLEEKNK